jgi:hypothetical protein
MVRPGESELPGQRSTCGATLTDRGTGRLRLGPVDQCRASRQDHACAGVPAGVLRLLPRDACRIRRRGA